MSIFSPKTFLLSIKDEYALINFDSSGEVTILCLYGAKFEVRNVTKVYFSGVTLLGCNGNTITDVQQLVFENSTVQGVPHKVNEGLEAFHASNILEFSIDSCSFINNQVVEVASLVCAVLKLNSCNITLLLSEFSTNSVMGTSESGLGSVICAFNSNVPITDSTFSNNRGITGGVVHAENSKIVALMSSFTSNIATLCGGVAYISQISDFTIDSCTFDENDSGLHGGVLCVTLESIVDAKHSSFVHNTAFNFSVNSTGRGGVLHLSDNSNSSFQNCSFSGNEANTSGVIYTRNRTRVSLHECIFTNNRALSPLAYLGYGAVISTQTRGFTSIRGCTFKNNSATSGGGCANIYKKSAIVVSGSNLFESNGAKDGGAFTVWDSTVDINRECLDEHVREGEYLTKFIGNTAEHGGALNIIENSTAHIYCTQFKLNSANRGGAILARTNTSVTLINTSFYGNYGIDNYTDSNHTDGKGGAIFAQFASISFDGSLIVDSNQCGSGVVYMSSCNVSIAGNSTFYNNKQSFLAHNSDMVFTGDRTFSGGVSNTTEESGAITAVRSNFQRQLTSKK